MIFLEFKIL